MFREMIQFSNNEVIEYLRKSRSDDPLTVSYTHLDVYKRQNT